VLASGEVDAIGAWQPSSGQALKLVPGSKAIFTSKDVPGLIYDCLYVDAKVLAERKADWIKVAKVWYKIVDYIYDEKKLDDSLAILSARVGVTPSEYEPFLQGTHILKPAEATKAWKKGEGLSSIYGSTKIVDDFNVKYKVYEKPAAVEAYFDPSISKSLLTK
jgi:NitT/TauT family transport system substrate-binding protein